MPRYSLVLNKGKSLHQTASNIDTALAQFGDVVDQELTLEDTGNPIGMLDEWEGDGPHWINPTIAIYQVSN